MSITKSGLLRATARELGCLTDDVRTPVEVFLGQLIRSLSAGKSVNLKHFGTFHPDGSFMPSPSMVDEIARGLSCHAVEIAADAEPATRGDLNRLIAALEAAGADLSALGSAS